MISDSSKGINSIDYNYQNLPVCITFSDGHITEYVYDASGAKRRAMNSLESVTTAGQLAATHTNDGNMEACYCHLMMI